MEILRIVVTGSVGAGKTSLIRSISEIEVVDTDKRATDEIAEIKSTTTVALDFGRLTVGENQTLHLYGTPGQLRFDFMWDILINKANAYIILVNASRPEDLRQAKRILTFMRERAKIPYLIGVTHTDCPEAWSLEYITIALKLVNEENKPPIIAVDANNKDSISQLLMLLVQQLMVTVDC